MNPPEFGEIYSTKDADRYMFCSIKEVMREYVKSVLRQRRDLRLHRHEGSKHDYAYTLCDQWCRRTVLPWYRLFKINSRISLVVNNFGFTIISKEYPKNAYYQ